MTAEYRNNTSVSRQSSGKQLEKSSFFPALEAVYDLIFEIDLSKDNVKCIHNRENSFIGPLYDMEMPFRNAIGFWLNNYVVEEDKNVFNDYFTEIITEENVSGNKSVFHIKWTDNNVYSFMAISIKPDKEHILICLKSLSQRSDTPLTIPQEGIFIRTFGHFDVFADGKPVIFSSSKEKELLALLIDRKGGTLTSSEAISCLWDIEDPDEKIKSKYRKLAMNMKNTLASYNIDYILKNAHGTRSIDTSKVKCDYYELLDNNEVYRSAFHNTYMKGYKWNEATLSLLWDYS